MITSAVVNIWGSSVGAIVWDDSNGLGTFEYEPSFLTSGLDLAPVKMPVARGAKRVYSFPELRNTSTFKGLPGLLADVLPDKYGNALINAWLSKNGRPADSMNPVEMLSFIGKRGMGALEFEPVIPKATGGATKIELDNLVDIAQQILSGRQDFSTHLSVNEEKALTEILKMGTSAGGA
ncbi:MAG: HipA N-terminal domain-containing protein, partial [Saprospiraceae bacterium]